MVDYALGVSLVATGNGNPDSANNRRMYSFGIRRRRPILIAGTFPESTCLARVIDETPKSSDASRNEKVCLVIFILSVAIVALELYFAYVILGICLKCICQTVNERS